MDSNYYALVLNLSKQGEDPVIVKASDLFKLTADNCAKRFCPRHDKDFQKDSEYGRKISVNGQIMMVRHIIFQLNADWKALKDAFENHGKKRFVAFKRMSAGLVCEPADNYTYPGAKKETHAQKKKVSKSVTQTKKEKSGNILQQFLSKKGEPEALFTPDVSHQVNSSTVKASETLEELGTKISGNLHAKEDNAVVQDTASDGHFTSEEIEQHIMTPEMLTKVAQEVIAEEESKKEVTFEICSNLEHFMLQKTVDELNIKLEAASREIEDLKSSNDFLKDKIKDQLTHITDLLKSNETQKPADDKIIVKKTKKSKVNELKNLLSDDEENMDDNEVKVGTKRYISIQDIMKVEAAAGYVTARIECLCDLFYKDNVGNFSVSSSDENRKITSQEMKSIIKILQNMKWSYDAEISLKQVRERLIKYTSAVRSSNKKGIVVNGGIAKYVNKVGNNSSKAEGKTAKKSMKNKEGNEDSEEEEAQTKKAKLDSSKAEGKTVKKSMKNKESDEDSEEEEEEEEAQTKKAKLDTESEDELNASIHLDNLQ